MSAIKTVEIKNAGLFRADYLEDLKKDVAKRLDEQKANRTSYTLRERVDEAVQYMVKRHKLDSGATNLMIRSLTLVMSGIKEVLYPGDILEKLTSINTQGGPGLVAINYEQLDYKGLMNEISAQATDIPEITSIVTEHGHRVGIFGGSYGISQVELERAARGTSPISQNKAKAAAMAVKKTKNNIFWNGSKSVKGFWGYELNDRTSTINADWAAATPQEVLDACFGVISAPGRTTEDFDADVLVVDPDVYYFLTTTYRSANSDLSLAEQILAKTGVGAILKTSYLRSVTSDTNGLSEDRVILAYPRNSMILEFMLPRNVQVFPMEKRGLQFVTDMLMDSAGTFIYHPQAIAFAALSALPAEFES